ncbi:MAG: hypothetical protein J6A69_07185 [Clostridia bacterium]|nr:hypothetical protein [Clostridia bacterium]
MDKIPKIDIDAYFFADDETVEHAQQKYAEDMKEYCMAQIKSEQIQKEKKLNIRHSEEKAQLKKDIYKKCIIIASIVLIGVTLITGFTCYNKGYKDNQSYAKDGSPIVYVTKSGSKYHLKRCKYASNGIEISQTQATDRHYLPCSKCKPNKYLK